MAADGVQDDDGILRARKRLFDVLQEDVVEAFAVRAVGGQVQRGHVVVFDVGAGTLAAGVVVVPDDAYPGALQDVKQVVAAAGDIDVKSRARLFGEHAGHGVSGVGAAAAHLRVVDDFCAARRELRRGLARVAVQPPVLRACRLADDKDAHPPLRVGFLLMCIGGDGLIRTVGAALVLDFADAGDDEVGRHDQVRHVVVVAAVGGVILVVKAGNEREQQQRQQHCAEAQRDFLPPAAVRHAHPQVQERRNDAECEQPEGIRHGQQFGTFGRRGNQHVGEHGAVEIDAEEDDGIADRRRQQQNQRDDEFVQIRQEQQVEDDVQAEKDKQRHAPEECAVAACATPRLPDGAEEAVVEQGEK